MIIFVSFVYQQYFIKLLIYLKVIESLAVN